MTPIHTPSDEYMHDSDPPSGVVMEHVDGADLHEYMTLTPPQVL